MQIVVFIIQLISILLCIAYCIVIAWIIIGWIQTKKQLSTGTNKKTKVTVIVAARNEAANIRHNLLSIIKQNYPQDLLEIVVVDDNSTDNTVNIIQELALSTNNIKLIELQNLKLAGKKNAIETAIKNSSGELIITTDADCIMHEKWIASIVNFQEHTNAEMIVSPVMFYNESTIFQKMQTLEFLALMGTTAGTLYYNKATLCNGANLAYTRKAVEAVDGFSNISHIPTGDDVLLMYKIKKHFPAAIHFLKSTDAVVYTQAQKNLQTFINQRIRWASKGFNNMNTGTTLLASIIYLFNSWIVLTGLFLLLFCASENNFYLQIGKIGLIIFGIKCFIDFLLLFLASRFFNKQKLLIYFLPEQFLYPIYIVITGIISSRKKYTWKERFFDGKAQA